MKSIFTMTAIFFSTRCFAATNTKCFQSDAAFVDNLGQYRVSLTAVDGGIKANILQVIHGGLMPLELSRRSLYVRPASKNHTLEFNGTEFKLTITDDVQVDGSKLATFSATIPNKFIKMTMVCFDK